MKPQGTWLGKILLIVACIILLSACAVEPERLWLKSPGWSRAVYIGNTRVNDSVPITINDTGDIYILIITRVEDEPVLRLMAFDPSGSLQRSQDYPEIELHRPSEPRFFFDGEGIRLFWISSDSLYTARVDETGAMITSPKVLSVDNQVAEYDAAMSRSGIFAIWFALLGDKPGLYASILDENRFESILIDSSGVGPELYFDQEENLHAFWANAPPQRGSNSFVYGYYPKGDLQEGEKTVVISPVIFGTTTLDGPHFGLDHVTGYIFWSLTYFSGPAAGTTEAFYVTFPIDNPQRASGEQRISIPFEYNLKYEVYEAGLHSGPRVHLPRGYYGGGTYLLQITPNQNVADELVVGLFSRTGYLMRDVRGQVNALYFMDSSVTSYQQLSFTSGYSSVPTILSDDSGYLYLTWLEKGQLPGWAVYFASTSPSIVKSLASLTTDDVGRLSAEVAFGMVTSALMIPVAMAWIVPSSVLMVVISWITSHNQRSGFFHDGFPIYLTIFLSWTIKVLIIPGILDYVPFSTWIPFVPPWLENPLRLIVPILILVLAWMAAKRMLRHKPSITPYRFYWLYSMVDAVLTMSIYGVIIVTGA
jgi:hypothetical protein